MIFKRCQVHAYVPTDLDGSKSFTIAWDHIVTRIDWSSEGHFGLYSADLLSGKRNQHDLGEHGKPRLLAQRTAVFRIALCAVNSAGTPYFAQFGDFSVGTWYHCVLSYDSLAGALTGTVTEKDDGALLGTTTVEYRAHSAAECRISGWTYIHSLRTDTTVSAAMGAPMWQLNYVALTPEPATLSSACARRPCINPQEWKDRPRVVA